jgi:ABC-type transporter Mla subunit MlaD
MDVQRFLIGLGLVILIAGIMWPMLSRIGLGRLPGDIMSWWHHVLFSSGHLHHHQPVTQRGVVVGQPLTSPRGARAPSPASQR